MTTIKQLGTTLLIGAMVCCNVSAQTKNDAVDAYNQGIAFMKTDALQAIAAFEKSVQICEQVGDSAKDLRDKAIQVIPDLYLQNANKLFVTDKKNQESLNASKVALQVAEKYGVTKTKDKLQKLMVQAYVALGSNYFKNKENDKALASFDSALTINPNYIKAIFNKALTLKTMGNSDKFGETIDLYIVKAREIGDTGQIATAKKSALDYYKSSGAKANQANKLADAMKDLNTTFKYGSDKDVYYHLASVKNKQKSFADAAINAQKGLDMDTAATAEAKAKFYYELGIAQLGKGEKDNACATFKNSMFGQFIEPSKGQRTNLKCK